MQFTPGMSIPKVIGHPNSRPTIGLLIGRLGDQRSQTMVWPGIADVAEERDVNLICFAGSALKSPYGLDAQRNIVYDLADKLNVDGLVALSGTLGHHIGPEQLKRFYERYRPLPIVGTSILLEGIPTVLVDNESGMRAAVSHLIEAHGRRRIAFVRGPAGHPEADQRYIAYVSALREHDLPLNPSLVAPGDFVYASGVDAIRMLLDQRRVKFDAVVVSNDETALGVLSALQQRGIAVPQDVALVGFDDVEEARFSTPPLTTTKQPLYQQGRCAAETLLALLKGEAVPEQITLPSQLMIRESCGCFHPRVMEAGASRSKRSGETIQGSIQAHQREIAQELLKQGSLPGLDSAWARNLLDAFLHEYADPADKFFLPAVQSILKDVLDTSGDTGMVQNSISIMRRCLIPYIKGKNNLTRAEDLWHQARVLICQWAQSEQAHSRLQVVRQSVTFSSISESLMTTFDLADLSNAIVKDLPKMGVESCYLSLYDPPVEGDQASPAEWSRLMLAYNRNGNIPVEPGGKLFRSRELVPDKILAGQGRYAMLLEPLHFGQEVQFGFILMGPLDIHGGAFREILLSRQISTALRVSFLLQQRRLAENALKKYSEKLEEMVEERTGELQEALQKARLADQMKSEFVANVNHELRTPLTNLILYYQLLSAYPTVKTKERLDVIGREIQRLRVLIENLLNLSRLDLTQETVRTLPQDFNKLIQSLVEDRKALAEERGLDLQTDLSEAIPSIWLDEAMIVQAISNLLTNALNYTPRGGGIQIRTQNIEDSSGKQWVVLSVKDTGPGINEADLPHIFERFYRGKAGRETSAPGTGLGLAIVREVIKKHRGRIDVENGPDGCGTLFTIQLPVEPPQFADQSGEDNDWSNR